MENYKYIKVPTSISFKEMQENDCCFAPSKYSRFIPNQNIEYMSLSILCTESTNKIQFNKKDSYHYSEIGDIDVNNGFVESNHYYGIDMPSENPKIIKQGDIVISTVRTYRGGIGYITNKYENQCCSPAMIVIRNVNPIITKEYLFSILRTDFFIEQILGFLNRGMYPRLDKEAMKHILIPIPKNKEILNYITIMTQAYLNKLDLIKNRHQSILEKIEKELLDNQKDNQFTFNLPTFNEVESVGRLDTGLYSREFKQETFLIHNYNHGFSTIYELGFTLSRGQNLQESNIGKSIYSDTYRKGFYNLILPTNFSNYGIMNKVSYLGNKKELKTLNQGEIVFGAEATFRSIVICEKTENYITNIHGITLYQKNLTLSIFVKCLMDYLAKKEVIDCVKVGGNGGSLAQKYWDIIPFPNFPELKQQEIAKLYHNPIEYPVSKFTLENFLELDNQYNEQAGIYELDKTSKYLKNLLNQAIESVVDDSEVAIKF